MNRLLTLLFLLVISSVAGAQPKYEVRAAWITAAYGLDWPRSKATTREGVRRQQQELERILDCLKEANFNTVIFQTRMRGDVSYRSEIEPYSSVFTGTVGGSPGYDPLAFAVSECHKRGMECHAWMVAVPLGGKKHVESLGKMSVTKRKRDICVAYKNEYFLNPGNPATKEYLMRLVSEVVSRYDVDGVQFDYLRYPERAVKFPDDNEYRRYGKGRSREQWRRDNLTEIVRYIYRGVKALKPWVKVSTCPVGKYRDTSRYPSRGWNAYNTVFQDPQGWLGEGIMDQIYPMLYFRGNHFYPFALDWQEQRNSRHIVPGLGIYFLDPREGNWTLDDVERQINFIRREEMAGAAFYRMRYLEDNTRGIYDVLRDNYYSAPALVPPMPWLDKQAPTAPSGLTVEHSGGYARLSWKASSDNDNRNAPRYVVYASDTTPVDTSDPRNIVACNVTATELIYTTLVPWQYKRHFAVTAVDRYGNESAPSNSR
jgi:uncharacterized lipoprotein YddW (UPF0748 family)